MLDWRFGLQQEENNDMKNRLLSILLISFICLNLKSYGQENILYFLGNTPQSNHINPAHFTDRSKVVINLPLLSGFDISLNNSFSFSDLVTIDNKTLKIDLNDFSSRLPETIYLSENYKMPLFDFHLRLKNRSFSFGIFENQLLRSGFDRNLIRLINEGNYPWLGSSVSTNFDFNFLHYREYSFGYSQPIIENLTMGSRVKLLTGLSVFDVQQMNIDIETGGNMEFLKFNATGSYNISQPFSLGFIDNGNPDGNTTDVVKYLTNFSNLGVAFDFGVKYQLLPSLEISASIIDLGFISWKSNAQRISHSSNFIWEGFNLSNITNQAGFDEAPYLAPLRALLDSVDEILDFTVEQTSFNTNIPTKIYLATSYQVGKIFEAGLIDRLLIYDNQISNALTLSGNLKLGTVFSLSAGYSIIDNSYNNLSLGTALKLGPTQFYLLTDNILAINLMTAQNFNFRFGMNLMFGKVKSDEQ
jgi:hypothetical protein